MKKIISAYFVILILVCVTAGAAFWCFGQWQNYRREALDRQSAQLLRQVISGDRRLSSLGITVQDATAIRTGLHTYKGFADVTMDGQSHEATFNILADSDQTFIETDAATFAFVLKKELGNPFSAPN